jgi:peroxiredoxin
LVALALWGCASSRGRAAAPGRPTAGSVLPTVTGEPLHLAELRGHPVVVFMFTTWSLRAQAEASRFVELHERLGPRGLKLLAVALDHETISRVQLETYLRFVGIAFPVALAGPDDLELVAAFGRTVKVPRTVLLDRQGRAVANFEGQTDFPRLRRAIEGLLGRATGPAGR